MLVADLFSDESGAGEHSDVLQVTFPTISEARRLDGADVQHTCRDKLTYLEERSSCASGAQGC